MIEGLYFSQAPDDLSAQHQSEAYVAHVQTRGLIVINATNAKIGMVAFLPVGMGAVSSVMINEEMMPGARVKKGQELGYFQFGGSTHVLLFQPGKIRQFVVDDERDDVKMGETIAHV